MKVESGRGERSRAGVSLREETGGGGGESWRGGMCRGLKDEDKGKIVGKYEIGRMIGIGTFAKVSVARNVVTGEEVAIKVINKKLIQKYQIAEQIKQEISTMHLIQHPNVIRIHEVIASKKKIYIVLELATGGELFDTITSRRKMKEDDARHYFQQLITAVDFCHSRGIYHRDLKPENLLLDSNGALKVTDFGLSALPHQLQVDGLLHTRCGSPNYVAPEVINNNRSGYDGAKSDLWSCGVILFVLLAGYLPFDEPNMYALYKKIGLADFTCPGWISKSARKLIKRILDPNPATRITMAELFKNSWFKKGYKPPIFEEASLNDVHDIFDESLEPAKLVVEQRDERPPIMNAFHIIAGFGRFDLSKLFENLLGYVKKETRFISKLPPDEVVSMIKTAVRPLGFRVEKDKKYKMKLLGGEDRRKGQLAITTEVYELSPSLSLVEVFKSKGDTVEFHKFFQDFMVSFKDVVWPFEQENNDDTSQTSNCSCYE